MRILALLSVFALAACGGDSTNNNGDGDGKGPGESCTNSTECRSDLVCGIDAVCEEPSGCADAADCPASTVCNGDGVCETNVTAGPCTVDRECIPGEVCGDAGACVVEEQTCGGDIFGADAIPPNVVIMLDRSGSMESNSIDGRTRWDIAKDAVTSVVNSYDDDIRFGFGLFPTSHVNDADGDQACVTEGNGGTRCDTGEIFVGPRATAGSDILTFMGAATTCRLSTPVAVTFDTALQGNALLQDPDRPNFVLLITDGADNCSGDPSTEIGNLRTEDGVSTFVVGFGSGIGGSDTEMNEMAEAGGYPRSGDTKYYFADDATSLNTALAEIAGQVLSCEYSLNGSPPDEDQVTVFFDKVQVPENGWSYDSASNTVSFSGATCDQLQSGSVGELEIVFGCPGAIVQ